MTLISVIVTAIWMLGNLRHTHHHTARTGHLDQGRFKSFPVQSDDHFLTVCRYVERNALGANLVARAEDWRWGSVWGRRGNADGYRPALAAWPIDRRRDWRARVNRPIGPKEEAAVRRSIQIDGFNLFCGWLKGTPHKWLDLAAFGQASFPLPGNQINRIRYFTAHVTSRPVPTIRCGQGVSRFIFGRYGRFRI